MSSSLADALSSIETPVKTPPDTPRLDQDVSQDPPTPPAQEIPTDIFAKAICLKLDMGCLGVSKKLGSTQIEVDADKNRISASKSILSSPQLDAIKREQALLSKTIRNICLPSILKAGVFLLPIASIADVDQILTEAQANILGILVPAFLEAYPNLVEADKLSLRGTYNAADYPPISKVRDTFMVDWSYISFGVPPELSSIDSDLFIREQQKAAARMTQAANDIQDLLRAQMLGLVNHLAEQMTGVNSATGKPKVLKDAAVVNVSKFLESFRAKNITDDKELDALCNQAKDLLNGVDPQALRDSITTREKVVVGFQSIKAELDKLMVDKPSRLIKFAEPGEE